MPPAPPVAATSAAGDAATAALRQALDRAAELGRQNTQIAGERDRARADLRTETANRLLAQETAVDNGIASAEAEHGAYKSQWAAAQAEADFPKAAEILGRMTEAAARLDRLKGQKEFLAHQRAQAASAPEQNTTPASAATDQLSGYAPHAREWISRNPRFLESDSFRADVIKHHHGALGAGHPEGSAAYYEHIERQVYPERFASGGGGSPTTAQDTPPANSPDQIENGHDGSPQIVIGDKDPNAMPANPNQPNIYRDGLQLGVSADGSPVEIKQEEQVRASGRPGAPGARSVAAPPSRALTRLIGQHQRNGPIHISGEEMDHARSLFWSIEDPNTSETARDIAAKGDIGIAEWYAGYRFSPAGDRYYRKHYGDTG